MTDRSIHIKPISPSKPADTFDFRAKNWSPERSLSYLEHILAGNWIYSGVDEQDLLLNRCYHLVLNFGQYELVDSKKLFLKK